MRADDADRVARIVEQHALRVYHVGRVATVQRWLRWFEDKGLLQRYRAIAVLAAWLHVLTGNLPAAERAARAAARQSFGRAAPRRSAATEGAAALLEAVLCRTGVEQMRADAETALTWLPTGSPWLATAHLLLGIAQLLADDPRLADATLTSAFEVAEDAGATVTASVALAERATLAMGREDWSEADRLAERARSIVREAGLDHYVTSTLVYAVTARIALHRGQVGRAREDLARAQCLRPQLTDSLWFLAVQTRLQLVRCSIALTDVAAARTMLREVGDLLRRRPAVGSLAGDAEQLRAQLDLVCGDAIGASSLTAAELRLLPQLVTHRSLGEIAGRLHVSPSTIKTQAIAIYRKFGVSSRSQAIQRAQELGLLGS
jgi:LuxR family maltose regulon positive regulatory protein